MSKKINIYNPITEKESKVDPYGRTAKNIYKYMIVNEGADPSDILPQDLTYINDRFVKVDSIVNTNNVRNITYGKVKASIGQNSSMPYLKKVMKSYRGKTVKLVKRYSTFDTTVGNDFDAIEEMEKLIKDGKKKQIDFIENIEQVEDFETFLIPEKGFTEWWHKNSNFFWIDSSEELFGIWNKVLEDDPKLQAQLLILTLDKVNEENFNQYFLDGITNCFFTPINDWAQDCLESSVSKSAEKRYKTIIKKVGNYTEKYSKGIPEEDMASVCNDLQISVEIDLPSTMLNKTKFIEVESQKKALKKFRYINTRLNHIELNKVNSLDNYEEVDKNTINKIKENSTKNKEFILWKESRGAITQINTLDQIYKLKDEGSYKDIVEKFEKKYNFSSYKIEKINNPELTKFLDNSLNCNQSITFMPECKTVAALDIVSECFAWGNLENHKKMNEGKRAISGPEYDEEYNEKKELLEWIENTDNLNHIDIKKAYANGHKCSQYQGYLGKVTDFRKTDKIVGLGIYQVKNINFNGCESIQKMKCFHNNGSYPSPELQYYQKLGITFDITMGCWGSSFDFEFNEDMYKKEKGVSHYCKWYGCLMKLNEKERYNFNCDKLEFAKLNACKGDIRYNKYKESGVIEYDKKYVYHSFHIASFIASYARITLLEQINKFSNFNQIVSVIVDGIYYSGDVEVGELFADKEKKSIKHNLEMSQYVPDNGSDYNYDCGEFRENNKIEVHLGAGGCGKTHHNLVDKGLVNTLFVAPSWKLARNKTEEYGIKSTTFYHILCDDPEIWKPLYRNYSTFLVDEISMFSNEDKIQLLKRYPYHKIIFCGDPGYQLAPIEGSEFIIGNLPVFTHTTNYRCKCKKLERILLWLRDKIKENSSFNAQFCISAFGIETVSINDMDYSVEDFIIASTNKTKDIYTEKFKHLEKYVVKSNSRDHSNGDIIIGPKPDKVYAELRHAFTISSAQGETAKNKLFIDMNKIRCLRTLYTALSRSQTLDQIKFTTTI